MDRVHLYDTVRRRFLPSYPLIASYNTMALDGGRLLAVEHPFSIDVYEHAGRIQIANYDTYGYHWHFGEDGSAWTLAGGRLAILYWRKGKPRVVSSPLQPRFDPRFVDSGHLGPEYVAVHGDGKLIACTETVQLLPKALLPTIQRAEKLLKAPKHLPREVRRLTLYRNNRRIGTFDVRISPGVSNYRARLYEHLAFTRDGEYLSWIIATGNGGQQVYAFRVPGQ